MFDVSTIAVNCGEILPVPQQLAGTLEFSSRFIETSALKWYGKVKLGTTPKRSFFTTKISGCGLATTCVGLVGGQQGMIAIAMESTEKPIDITSITCHSGYNRDQRITVCILLCWVQDPSE
jgi:hypothetical protein